MSFKIYSIIILVIALFLISCQEQSPVETTSTSNISDLFLAKKAPKASPDSEFDGHYMIIASGNALPAGLSKSVVSAKGKLTGKMEKIGLASAYSEDPNFAETLSALKGITAVIPDLKVNRIKPIVQPISVVTDAANPPNSGDDDFLFDFQWGHDAVDAPEAWELGYRGAGVRVFILDEGFDMEHPDLTPNLNTGLATSFVEGEPNPDYLLNDGWSHATHTAGTIGAADNGLGTIGIAPEAELVPVKVLSESMGYGYTSWIIQGVLYAAENGADVINMSLGGGAYRSLGAPDFQKYVMVPYKRALNYAYQMGATVVAAAGNEGLDRNKTMDLLLLPADAPNVLTISATAPLGWAEDPAASDLDLLAFYSNYGTRSIDFAAPGGSFEIYFYPGGQDPCTVAWLTRPCYVFDMVLSTGSQGGWYWEAGTSMAAPHAAGVAALIIGKNGGSMDPSLVKEILKESSDDLGKPGKDALYGHGRVNAYNAVK